MGFADHANKSLGNNRRHIGKNRNLLFSKKGLSFSSLPTKSEKKSTGPITRNEDSKFFRMAIDIIFLLIGLAIFAGLIYFFIG